MMPTLGEQITQRRHRLVLTQQEIADKAGVCLSHISLIESDKRDPSLRVLNKLAAALNCQVYILWQDIR